MSSPANMLPPEYDDVQPNSYDPEFTAHISTKMRVPHKLGVDADEAGDPSITHERQVLFEQERHLEHKRTADMHVPEKIVVVGQEQSMGLKSDLRLDFETSPMHNMQSRNFVSLRTPPRVLTLEEQPFPSVIEEKLEEQPFVEVQAKKAHQVSFQNGFIPLTVTPSKFQKETLESEALDASALMIQDEDEDDDLKILQKKVAKLSLHMLRLQEENSKRSQREIVFYPLVIGYVLFQVARWFLRRDY